MRYTIHLHMTCEEDIKITARLAALDGKPYITVSFGDDTAVFMTPAQFERLKGVEAV